MLSDGRWLKEVNDEHGDKDVGICVKFMQCIEVPPVFCLIDVGTRIIPLESV